MKKVLLALCDELSKKKPDKQKVNRLLKEAKISPSEDPFALTNEVLKKLHTYDEVSDTDVPSPAGETGADDEQTI